MDAQRYKEVFEKIGEIMKKILLILLFCLFATNVFADVTAEILSYDLDDNGNIRVKTQYKIDGIEVKSPYPLLDGKYYFVTRYNIFNFVGMTDEQIKARIVEDVTTHANTLIQQTFTQKQNTDIYANHLTELTGSKVKQTNTTIILDIDSDGVSDREWLIKTDGTYSEKVITP